MPRLTANGAIVSDNGEWWHGGVKWKPLVENPTARPGLKESAAVTQMATAATAIAGRKLVKMVAEHGSLEAAELAMGEIEAAGAKQKIVTYKNAAEFEAEAPKMLAKGWRVQGSNNENNHTTVGRVGAGVVVGGVLTGGFGALIGGALGAASKKKGSVQVIWERD
ncbi:hypothetical protein [Nocardiopsis sp. NPDC058789]|uniref:hypothetical protein n=1 Tax=Nocardiopsis TaxID=2013 RepID=UPI0036712529